MIDQPPAPRRDTLRPLVDAVRAWSATRVFVATALGIGLVLLLEYATGRDVTVAQLFLAPIALATLARGGRVGFLAAGASTLVGFVGDQAREAAPSTLAISLWNWGIRGASFFAFAALLASLSERIAREAALARTDTLTGAVNRLAFLEALALELARARRAGRALTLVYVDLDRFKSVNDAHGHDEGDRLLRAVVETARSVVRETDVVARLGGDEFALLLIDADGARARAAAERVLAAWNQRATEESWPVRLSLGLATSPAGATGPEALIEAADRSMYAAKRAGGDRIEQAHLVA